MATDWRAAALAREAEEAAWKAELAELKAARAAYAAKSKVQVRNANTFTRYVPPPSSEPVLLISTLAELMMPQTLIEEWA